MTYNSNGLCESVQKSGGRFGVSVLYLIKRNPYLRPINGLDYFEAKINTYYNLSQPFEIKIKALRVFKIIGKIE